MIFARSRFGTSLRRKWTDEIVKEAILERKASGRSMRIEVVQKEDSGLANAAYRRFGGWYRALEEAGLVSDEYVTHKPAVCWTKDRILSEIAALRKERRPLNHRFVWKSYKGHGKAARRVFGSWRNAVEVAGIDYGSVMLHKGRQSKWTDETVKKAILARHASGNIAAKEPCYSFSGGHFSELYTTPSSECEGPDLNRRTPTGTDLESVAIGR